jgi:uncharacterized membrane protein
LNPPGITLISGAETYNSDWQAIINENLFNLIPKKMIYYLKLYFATLAVFFAVDMVWLGLVARSFYKRSLGYIMAPTVSWFPAIIFYLLFIVGILVFVVLPGVKENSLKITILKALLFGLITYATYDLTNLATINQWPLSVTLIDLAWGMVLSTIVSITGFYVAKWL